MPDANQSAEPGRVAAAPLDPLPKPIVFSPHMKYIDGRRGRRDRRPHLRPEFGGDPFVSIHHEHPRMLVRRLIQPGISLGRIIVELSLNHARTHLLCYRDRAVAAEGVQNDDVVCLPHRPETIGKVAFFVQGQDEDRQAHSLARVYAWRPGAVATAGLSSCYGNIKNKRTGAAVDRRSGHAGALLWRQHRVPPTQRMRIRQSAQRDDNPATGSFRHRHQEVTDVERASSIESPEYASYPCISPQSPPESGGVQSQPERTSVPELPVGQNAFRRTGRST